MTYMVLCILMVFLVACFIASRLLKSGIGSIFTKTMASLGMVFGAVLSLTTGYSYFHLYIILGVICGMLGDIFLELKRVYPANDYLYFNFGMTAFAVGHIMYLIALIKMINASSKMLVPALISIAVAVAFSSLLILVLAKPLKLDFGKCKWQSYAYCILLTFLTVFSIFIYFKTEVPILLPLGFIAFLLSDLILSLQYFGGEGKIDQPVLVTLNHVLYYGAQVMLIGILF